MSSRPDDSQIFQARMPTLYTLFCEGIDIKQGSRNRNIFFWPWYIVDVSNLIELCELCKCSREVNLIKASAIDMVLCWWRLWLVEKVWNAIVGSLLPVLLLFSWSVLVHFHYLIHFERPWNIPGRTQCKTPVDRWHKVVCGKKVLVSVVRPRAFGWWAHKGHCGHLWAYSRADVVSPTIPVDKYWLTTTAVSVVQKIWPVVKCFTITVVCKQIINFPGSSSCKRVRSVLPITHGHDSQKLRLPRNLPLWDD